VDHLRDVSYTGPVRCDSVSGQSIRFNVQWQESGAMRGAGVSSDAPPANGACGRDSAVTHALLRGSRDTVTPSSNGRSWPAEADRFTGCRSSVSATRFRDSGRSREPRSQRRPSSSNAPVIAYTVQASGEIRIDPFGTSIKFLKRDLDI
jgi:hypothetical protein